MKKKGNYVEELVLVSIITSIIEKLAERKAKEKCKKCKFKQKR
jgi:hypothetical protein